MIKIPLYLLFVCLTGYKIINGLPAIAGGCSIQMNKTAKIMCAENDIECKRRDLKIYY